MVFCLNTGYVSTAFVRKNFPRLDTGQCRVCDTYQCWVVFCGLCDIDDDSDNDFDADECGDCGDHES